MTNEERLDAIFSGLRRAYGTYRLPNADEIEEGEKHEGKAVTLKQDLTLEQWRDHLNGTTSVGVTPIDDDDSVSFGAIDIDVYKGLDVAGLCQILAAYPVIPCRTKSGGIHVYLFTSEKVPAILMQKRLRELAQLLGHGTAEVFPKQTHLLTDRGDVGSWINTPYCGGDASNRYSLTPQAEKESLSVFLDRAEKSRISKADLRALKFGQMKAGGPEAATDERFEQAPPCLQFLASQGFPEGARNNGLTNIAVYLKLRFPETWGTLLDDYNQRYLVPPLPAREVVGIEKSVERKDYAYLCSQPPISPYCNRDKCLKMQYGISAGSGATLALTNPRLLASDPPVYFVDVDGVTVDFQTEDLQQQTRFQRRLMEVKKFWLPQKNDTWQKTLKELVDNTQTIEVPEQSTEYGHFLHLVFQFFRLHVQTESVQACLTLQQPYYDEKNEEVCFLLPQLMPFVRKQGLTGLHHSKAVKYLHRAGATHYEYKDDESDKAETYVFYCLPHKITDRTVEVTEQPTKEVF